MALNVTQVNQAFLGLLGRPATGAEAAKFAGQLDAATLAQTLLTDASFKNELSVETLSFKTVDLLNTDPAAFVESLYTALLGRASDAEGKAFWLSVAGITPNRADVVSQFIAAVQAQEGSADANAFATIQAEDKALANAWVESLYNNLAGRASDAEGLDFWTNAIVSFAMTPAQVAASFAAALALQGNTTEDGQNYLAKQGIADNFTASFKDFSTLITANEKTEALKNLVTMMNGVNKDSQVEQYTQEITKITDEYQNFKSIQFTTSDEDNLGVDPETGEPNTTSGVNFTGTYNLTDPEKGTIQSNDSATGNPDYLTDTLTVNVTGYDKNAHDTFNLNDLPSTSSIEKLVINNGAASVNGDLADFEYINVNGTGSFAITATAPDAEKGLKDISLKSAAKTDNSFSTISKVVSFKSAAGNDTVTLGTVTKSLSTGAGDDTVNANLAKDATADLGAGDDEFKGILNTNAKLTAGAGDDTLTVTDVSNYKLDSKGKIVNDKNGKPVIASTIEIDGGTGEDTLDLSTPATPGSSNFQGIKSIKGIESLKVGTDTTLMASAISGQKMELSGNSLTLNASGATTVDLSKFTAADKDINVTIKNVKSSNVSLETSEKDFKAIKETVILTQDAKGVNIKGFEKANDHLAIENVSNSGLSLKDLGSQAINYVQANTLYSADLKDKITTKANLQDYLDSNNIKIALAEKAEFFIIATDTVGTSSAAKVYRVQVGKDKKVAKVDLMANVNVSNKDQLDTKADVISNVTADPIPVPESGTKLDLSKGSAYVDATQSSGAAAITVDATKATDGTASLKVASNSGQKVDTILESNAKINTFEGGAGDDTITLKGGNGVNVIKGGEGVDTVLLNVTAGATPLNLHNLELVDVENLQVSGDFGGMLGAKAINSVTKNIKLDADLNIIVTASDTSLNLTNVSGGSSKIHNIRVDKDANITLGENGNVDSINLEGNGTVTISGKDSGATVTVNAKDGNIIDITNAKGEKVTFDLANNKDIETDSFTITGFEAGAGDDVIKLGGFALSGGSTVSDASGAQTISGDGWNKLLVSAANTAVKNASGAELTLAEVTAATVVKAAGGTQSISFGNLTVTEATATGYKGQFAVLAKDGVAVYNFEDGASSGDLTVTLVAVVNDVTGISGADLTFA